ncbi:LysR family transcriptional regulator [Klebsiella sp. Ap-873]|uniref:LysR family transcriptional regulator n=1 Tax=Cedecea neteri TaxID=158822 RepID=A0AAN0S6P6_9ENTR|nr:LysR family transcriptional regulator [Cedecea neteri]AIR62603.1 LysR family transcriptional regulator [Cedecea neteri]NIG77474.1 LysR family transcriptional regulator [Klebsiella sp. Ap-873]
MKRHFEEMQIGTLELFCQAAEQLSFSAAANFMGITPAAVSRSIARLEERLGVRLFVRTTRQIRLTESGERYFRQCQQALQQLREAEREVTGAQIEPAGVLRISLPTPYSHYRVLPLLPEFRQLYPRVSVQVHISNRNIDFADESYDIAIRGRSPQDSSLIARKLEDAELITVASPAYLARAGIPKTLDDLNHHECIQFELPSTGRKVPWTFSVDGKDTDIFTQGGFTCAEDVLGIVTLARSGAGLIQTYRFILEQDVADGTLVEVLPEYGGTSRPFILLYPHARHLSLRVRSLVDFLVQRLGT